MGWIDEWNDDGEIDDSNTLSERREFVRGGRVVARGYRSPDGMLRAVEQNGEFAIRRIWGTSGGTLRCTPDELELVERALRWADKAAESWAHYEYGYYKDPTSRLRLPGSPVLALPRGEKWNLEELVRAEEPQAVAPGVMKIASLWHPPERIGPTADSEVGAIVKIGGSLIAWCSGPLAVMRKGRARRRARAPAAALWLYSTDSAFLAELRKCAAATPSRDSSPTDW